MKKSSKIVYNDSNESGDSNAYQVKIKIKNNLIDLKDLVNLCNFHCEECPYFYKAVKEHS